MTEHVNSISFGRCLLFPATRILLGDEQPVKLGARALDLLVCLAKGRGDVVSQDDLMKAAWPNATVGGNTLRVQIKNLRAALAPFGAENSIVNRSGRGYEFTDFTESHLDPTEVVLAASGSVLHLIGRNSIVALLVRGLATERCITLSGTGGIGKTAIAKEVRELIAPSYGDGTHFVDLSTIEDEKQVPALLARSLGLSVMEEDPTPSILQFLVGSETLVVLDTCERVLSAAAALVEAVLTATNRVDFLTTSREALRIRHERIVEVPPLEFPLLAPEAPVDQLLNYAAPRLFLNRAVATGYIFRDEDARLICELCARLDGLPLAIELAAGRARDFGVGNLLHQLDDRFTILGEGYRTAAPRQRALRATLDWSYDLLSHQERLLLDRISIFRGEFSLDAACEVARSNDLPREAIPRVLGHLVQKSLVISPAVADDGFRLLDTTRAYARDNLTAAKAFDDMALRHAEFVLSRMSILERYEAGSSAVSKRFNDVRAALDWAISHPDRRELYLKLVIAAVPYMVENSLIDECRRNAVVALSILAPGDMTSLMAMQLHAALGGAYMNIDGAGERTAQAWREVYRISGKLRDIHYRLMSLWGLWVEARNKGNYARAFSLAKRYARLARQSDDRTVERNLHRMLGISYFFAGDFNLARQSLERMLQLTAARRRESIRRFQFDPVVTARCFLAQILWMQGHPDQANSLAARNVADALELNHAGTLFYSLTEGACPVSVNTGDLESAARYCDIVLSRAAGKGHEVWRTLGECFLGIVTMRRGEPKGFAMTEEALRALRLRRFGPFFTRALGEFALALARNGQLEEAWAAVTEGVDRAVKNGEGWCLPELLRIRAVVAMARGRDDGSIEIDLLQSIELAKIQNALGWQLRTATSLAMHYQARMELSKARSVLEPVLDHFREGFITTDVQTALGLVEQIDFEMKLERIAHSA
ncbi:winged helix-turn-helix domain-containing protein [Rhizobium leguminosarum]|uniref:winged helix-turn-helix domain-containing protein n=1 Tax=Rhizobium leguminosarum TaxID=384 RepID=UPI003F95CBB1